jgi:predicted dehydrogenase
MIDRVLIVGYGSIGSRQLRLLRDRLPYADIRILRHKFSDSLPIEANGVFFQIEEALSFRPNLVVITNPSSHHIDVAIPFARIGSHLFIEKPISNSIKNVAELLSICEDRGLILAVGYNLRYLQTLNYFRGEINQGLIGRVLSVECRVGQYLPDWRPNINYRDCVSGNKSLGGGVLLELSHEIDYLRWIFGSVQWVSANLETQSSLDIDVEDSANILMSFESSNGFKSTIANLSLDFVRHDKVRCCLAIGEYGTLAWNGLSGEVSLYSASERSWKQLLKHENDVIDSYESQCNELLNCIEGSNKIYPVSGNDGLETLKVIDAIRDSNDRGMKIYLSK